MDHASLTEGEVTLDDHASAVIRVPMWKLAIVLHESEVYLDPFSVPARARDASTYHDQDLDCVSTANSEEIDAVLFVACSYHIDFRAVRVSDVGHGG